MGNVIENKLKEFLSITFPCSIKVLIGEKIFMSKIVFDLSMIGKQYGRWTILEYLGKNERGAKIVRCRCSCLNQTERNVILGDVLMGRSTNCGCVKKEKLVDRNTTHNKYRTTEYKTWTKMIERCYDKNCPKYKNYGERGITICDEWRNSFEKFYEDMGEKPGKGYTIDRIDNDGNYEPLNCRWATAGEQSRNKSSNRWLSFDGKTMILRDWATLLEIDYSYLCKRLKKGKSFAQIIKKENYGSKSK